MRNEWIDKSIYLAYHTDNQIVTRIRTIHSCFEKATANIVKKNLHCKFFPNFFSISLVSKCQSVKVEIVFVAVVAVAVEKKQRRIGRTHKQV